MVSMVNLKNLYPPPSREDEHRCLRFEEVDDGPAEHEGESDHDGDAESRVLDHALAQKGTSPPATWPELGGGVMVERGAGVGGDGGLGAGEEGKGEGGEERRGGDLAIDGRGGVGGGGIRDGERGDGGGGVAGNVEVVRLGIEGAGLGAAERGRAGRGGVRCVAEDAARRAPCWARDAERARAGGGRRRERDGSGATTMVIVRVRVAGWRASPCGHRRGIIRARAHSWLSQEQAKSSGMWWLFRDCAPYEMQHGFHLEHLEAIRSRVVVDDRHVPDDELALERRFQGGGRRPRSRARATSRDVHPLAADDDDGDFALRDAGPRGDAATRLRFPRSPRDRFENAPSSSSSSVSVVAAASPRPSPRPPSPTRGKPPFPMSFTASVEDALRADEVVILGTRASLSDPSAIAALPPGFARAFPARSATSSPATPAPSALMLPRDDADDADDSDLVEVTFGVLPSQTTLSRHNCPAAPQALAGALSRRPARRTTEPGHRRVPRRTRPRHPRRRRRRARVPPVHRQERLGSRHPRGSRRDRLSGRCFAAKESNASSTSASKESNSLDIRLEILIFLRFRDRSRRSPAARVVDAPPATMDPDALVREAEEMAADPDAGRSSRTATAGA